MSKRILVALAALLALTASVASANAKPVHYRLAYPPAYQYYGYYDYAPGYYSYGYAPYYGNSWNWW